MHTIKKNKKRKADYSVSVLAAAQTSPRQHLKYRFSKSDAFKETTQKRRDRLIEDLRFSP
jgi:hypothetical protein